MLPHVALGDHAVPVYPLVVAFGVMLCWALLVRRTDRLGLPRARVLAWVALAFPVGALGGRGLAILVDWTTTSELHVASSGMSVLGALLACLAFSMWLIPRLLGTSSGVVLDAVAFTLPLAMVFGRLGCLALGCCFGRTVEAASLLTIPLGAYGDASPAMQFYSAAGASADLLLWNLPALLIAASLVNLAIVEWHYRRPAAPGTTMLLALTLDLGLRAPVELTRGGPWVARSEQNPWLLLSLTLATAFGVMLLAKLRPRRAASAISVR